MTGEHGIGVEKMEFMPKLFSPADLAVMIALRNAFNPEGRCKPRQDDPRRRWLHRTQKPRPPRIGLIVRALCQFVPLQTPNLSPATHGINPSSRTGSDSRQSSSSLAIYMFQSKLRTGSDLAYACSRPDSRFQSTLPHGERQAERTRGRYAERVSIHAPAR